MVNRGGIPGRIDRLYFPEGTKAFALVEPPTKYPLYIQPERNDRDWTYALRVKVRHLGNLKPGEIVRLFIYSDITKEDTFDFFGPDGKSYIRLMAKGE